MAHSDSSTALARLVTPKMCEGSEPRAVCDCGAPIDRASIDRYETSQRQSGVLYMHRYECVCGLWWWAFMGFVGETFRIDRPIPAAKWYLRRPTPEEVMQHVV